MSFAPACTPSRIIVLSGTTGRQCQDLWDYGETSDEVVYESRGRFRTWKLFIPLRQQPTTDLPAEIETPSSYLIVYVTGRSDGFQAVAATLESIARTIRPY